MHIIAVSQLSHTGPGRDYYEAKLAEGKTPKEAMRSLSGGSPTPFTDSSASTPENRARTREGK